MSVWAVKTRTEHNELTRNVLDCECDQSNHSSRIIFFIFSYTFTLEYKYELDRMNRFRDMSVENYTRQLTAVILNLVQPEVETFDSPTRKPYPRTKMKRIG